MVRRTLSSQSSLILISIVTAPFWWAVDNLVCAATTDQRPNVVYFMADDLGIGDVKCYGQKHCMIETPNFDQLAKEGMKFTDAHPSAAVCIPTRMAIMTGRYPWRFRRPKPDGPWGYLNPRISPNCLCLGTLMTACNYHTGYVGKWHLGTLMQTVDGQNQDVDNVNFKKQLQHGPADHEFGFSFILPGSLDMYPYVFARNHHFVGEVTEQRGWSAFNRVGATAKGFEDYEVVGAIGDEAVAFIDVNADAARTGQPFFLYVATTSPHTPTCPSPAFQGKSKLGVYGDFVMETDDCLGRVLRALQKHKLDTNTIVIATSDHGAAPYAGNTLKATKNNIRQLEQHGHYSSGIYRGYKFSVYEGGLRVPLLVRWPGVVSAGSECDRLVGLVDLMATLADLGNYDLADDAAPDSVSFLPLLKDAQGPATRDSLVMQSIHNAVVRQNHWKLALCPGSGGIGLYGNKPTPEKAWRAAIDEFGRKPFDSEIRSAPFVQLYNLRDDIREQHNLAAENAPVVSRLVDYLDQCIANGRSTPGPQLQNDLANIDFYSRVPKFVRD